MAQTTHFQQYNTKRKIKECQDVGQKWSLGNTYIDKLSKLNDPYAISSPTIATVQDPSPILEESEDECIVNMLNAKNLSLFLVSNNSSFFFTFNTHKESPNYDNKMLSYCASLRVKVLTS